jgi:hypothetical protein
VSKCSHPPEAEQGSTTDEILHSLKTKQRENHERHETHEIKYEAEMLTEILGTEK